MTQEIEIEFKTMLTEQEFNLLQQKLPFPEQAIVQTNHYFDTGKFAMKDKRSALRIREKDGRFTLTLKEPHPEGILETHDSLSKHEAQEWFDGKPLPQINVTKQLQKLGIAEENLQYYGALKTERFFYREGKIDYMLDKSYYHGVVDYELEIEAHSYEAGLEALRLLLQTYNIAERKAEPKIARFFRVAF